MQNGDNRKGDNVVLSLRLNQSRHSLDTTPKTQGGRRSAASLPERGVALVITLILLAVTLIMAVALLAVARRERNSVTTSTDTATARQAADTALAAAQAQMMANLLANNTGPYNYGLFVSTNFLTTNPYDPTQPGNILPRPPVFITNPDSGVTDFRFYLDLNRNGQFDANGLVTNVDSSGNPILDANNNPVVSFEAGDPEWVGILEHPDQPPGPNNSFIARYAYIAVPAGNALDLNTIHNQTLNGSSANPFNPANDGYFRNEGVGSWEMNLAAFLADLNTNIWGQDVGATANFYQYNQANQPTGFANSGVAFNDAQSLLAWRYADTYGSLALAPPNVQTLAGSGLIDSYAFGNLMTTPELQGVNSSFNVNNTPWAGSVNPNQFFSLASDLFDPNKSSPAFTNRLGSAGNNTDTYDRYTFYRMLNELGTDSAPDDNRMNLNYDNLDANGNVVPGSETNAIDWTTEPGGALKFFTNAANLMLEHYTAKWIYNPGQTNLPNPFYVSTFNVTNPFGIGNIPVLVSNQFVYSPAVNRLLQLAANLYDASSTNFYPSVFRPTFLVTNENGFNDVYINGYQNIASVTGTTDPRLNNPSSLVDPLALAAQGPGSYFSNAYGVPWIIGAKKYMPGFNELYSLNTFQLTRFLQLTRSSPNQYVPTATNEMFIMDITNQLGFSFWNSYNANYNGNLSVYLNDTVLMTLTNGANTWLAATNVGFTVNNFTPWPGSAWTQSGTPAPDFQTITNSASFVFANFNIPGLPSSQYSMLHSGFVPVSQAQWENVQPGPPVFPQFGLLTTNWMQAYILDTDGNGVTHVIDYVQLRGPNSTRNLNSEINDPNDGGATGIHDYMWSTNAYGFNNPNAYPTYGVVNQINVSRTDPAGTIANSWKNPGGLPPGVPAVPAAEAAFFNGFFFPNWSYGGHTYFNTNQTVQAPYTPTRTAWQYTLWQANDPLVHYLASDLNTATKQTGYGQSDDLTTKQMPSPSLNSVGERYQPWGRYQQMAELSSLNVDPSGYNLSFRDPLVWGSDYWDFPHYKYPTVGWVGRVHRGTPWQTVYLKSSDVLAESGYNGTQTWTVWTGDTQTAYNPQNGGRGFEFFDAANSAPVQDSDLFDLFSTSLSGNATRGTLSVNQTGLAAWSAVLSGVVALTNATVNPASYIAPVITNAVLSPAGPAGNSSVLGYLVNDPNVGINAVRANFENDDGVNGAFEHVGDILRVPALTVQSPFLNLNASGSPYNQLNAGISDELYEWLPQQMLGLLRLGGAPRYVIYCWGQTLRPAPNGELLVSGSNFGMVTNYQITAESAARAVIQVVAHPTATGTNYTTTIENYSPLPPN